MRTHHLAALCLGSALLVACGEALSPQLEPGDASRTVTTYDSADDWNYPNDNYFACVTLKNSSAPMRHEDFSLVSSTGGYVVYDTLTYKDSYDLEKGYCSPGQVRLDLGPRELRLVVRRLDLQVERLDRLAALYAAERVRGHRPDPGWGDLARRPVHEGAHAFVSAVRRLARDGDRRLAAGIPGLSRVRARRGAVAYGIGSELGGLHPGLGGTARFTHLVNPTQAMTLMLTGRTIDARRAKSLGLVADGSVRVRLVTGKAEVFLPVVRADTPEL